MWTQKLILGLEALRCAFLLIVVIVAIVVVLEVGGVISICIFIQLEMDITYVQKGRIFRFACVPNRRSSVRMSQILSKHFLTPPKMQYFTFLFYGLTFLSYPLIFCLS